MMDVKKIGIYPTVPVPRDVTHDTFIRDLLATRTQTLPEYRSVGIPNPSSQEELAERSLGLDLSVLVDFLHPKVKRSQDPFAIHQIKSTFMSVTEPATEEENPETDEVHPVANRSLSPIETAKMRHNVASVSRFTFSRS